MKRWNQYGFSLASSIFGRGGLDIADKIMAIWRNREEDTLTASNQIRKCNLSMRSVTFKWIHSQVLNRDRIFWKMALVHRAKTLHVADTGRTYMCRKGRGCEDSRERRASLSLLPIIKSARFRQTSDRRLEEAIWQVPQLPSGLRSSRRHPQPCWSEFDISPQFLGTEASLGFRPCGQDVNHLLLVDWDSTAAFLWRERWLPPAPPRREVSTSKCEQPSSNHPPDCYYCRLVDVDCRGPRHYHENSTRWNSTQGPYSF